jgi:hypothetical protein
MKQAEANNEFFKLLHEHLIDNIDAVNWVLAFVTYCHAIDDIIDNDIPKDKSRQEFIIKTFEFSEILFTNVFYLQHINILRPLVKMTANTYADSVQWEDSPIEYKRKIADVLRQMGNEVILAVIEIVKGVGVRREVSMKFRELSWLAHH